MRMPGGMNGEAYDEFGGELGTDRNIKDDFEAAEALRVLNRAKEISADKTLIQRAKAYARYRKEQADREYRLVGKRI